jgi:hypothetical protein
MRLEAPDGLLARSVSGHIPVRCLFLPIGSWLAKDSFDDRTSHSSVLDVSAAGVGVRTLGSSGWIPGSQKRPLVTEDWISDRERQVGDVGFDPGTFVVLAGVDVP